MNVHNEAVETISAQVAKFHDQGIPFRLYHGSTNSTQSRKVDPSRMVDTSKLNHVISIDGERKTCLVEPNVPMDQLADATLPYGLVPQVVMEFPGITVRLSPHCSTVSFCNSINLPLLRRSAAASAAWQASPQVSSTASSRTL